MNPPSAPTPACSTAQLTLHPEDATDSRGRPTVAVLARCGPYAARGDCPAGASKGADEAQTVAIDQARRNMVQALLPALVQAAEDLSDPFAVARLDAKMAGLAGDNFRQLGANAVLPISRALWRLGAQAANVPLWQFLGWAQQHRAQEGSTKAVAPVLMLMNIFNGGLHALRKEAGEQLGRDRIDIQEVMVVPMRAQSYAEATAQGEAIDAALETRLVAHYGRGALSRADEAGFSVKGLGDSDAAIAHVFEAVRAANLIPGRDVKLALDVAASSFYDAATQRYHLGGRKLTSEQMVAWLIAFVERYPGAVLSIEDGLDENDWEGWACLRHEMDARGVVTIGDDLFVTQLPRLRRGIAEQSASAILIKVNQNGTVGGTLEVMRTAHAAGLRCVVSHRSGETLDDSIADLAVGAGAWGLKSGDPQPVRAYPDEASWVRRVKYLRLAAIESAASSVLVDG